MLRKSIKCQKCGYSLRIYQKMYWVKVFLEDLIKTGKIPGFIRPMGGVYYYVVLETVVPTISQIHIGDTTSVQTGDISIQSGEKNYCPNCGYKLKKEWNTCPQCALSLKKSRKAKIYCTNCGKKVQTDWKVCPYCSINL